MIGNYAEAVNICFYTVQVLAYPTDHISG